MPRSSILASLAVKLGLDSSSFGKGMKKADLELKRFSRKAKSYGKAMTLGITLPLTGASFAAVKLSSDARETQNRFNQTFKSMSGEVNAFAENLAKATGRDFFELQEGLASFQAFSLGLGMASDNAASFSKRLQKVAVDFSSFNNKNLIESQQRVIAVLSGSSEAMDQWGVNTKEAALSQKLLELGLAKSTKEATELQKATARLSILEETLGSQGAVGDAQRTLGDFANQTRALRADFRQMAIELGDLLKPLASDLVATARASIQFFRGLDNGVKKSLVVISGIVAVGGPLMLGLGALAAAVSAIGASTIGMAAAVLVAAGNWNWAVQNIRPAWDRIKKTIVEGASFIFKTLEDVISSMISLTGWMPVQFNAAAVAFKTMVTGLKKGTDDLAKAMTPAPFVGYGQALKNTFSGVGSFIKGAFSSISKQITTSNNEIEQKIKRVLSSTNIYGNTPNPASYVSFDGAVFDSDPKPNSNNIKGVKNHKRQSAFYEMTQTQIAQAQALASAFDNVGEAFANSFIDGIAGAKSFGEAFKVMASTIVDSLKEVAKQLIKIAILKGIANIIMPGAGAVVSSSFDLASGIINPDSWRSDMKKGRGITFSVNGRQMLGELKYSENRTRRLF